MPEEKGGSTDTSFPTGQNKIAQISVEEALARIITLENDLTQAKKTIEEVTTQLKEANDVLEAQEKAKIMSDILPKSKFSIEDLKDKGLEELRRIRTTLEQAKMPTFKNIRLGPVNTTDEKASNLTVGSLFCLKNRHEERRS